jgi:hypothetical protein
MQVKHPFKLLDLIVKERASQRSVLSASCLPSWRSMPRYSRLVYFYLTNITLDSNYVTHHTFNVHIFTHIFELHGFPAAIVFLAVRWQRLPYGDVRNLRTEPGFHVSPSTVTR